MREMMPRLNNRHKSNRFSKQFMCAIAVAPLHPEWKIHGLIKHAILSSTLAAWNLHENGFFCWQNASITTTIKTTSYSDCSASRRAQLGGWREWAFSKLNSLLVFVSPGQLQFHPNIWLNWIQFHSSHPSEQFFFFSIQLFASSDTKEERSKTKQCNFLN